MTLRIETPEEFDDLMDRLPSHARNKVLEAMGEKRIDPMGFEYFEFTKAKFRKSVYLFEVLLAGMLSILAIGLCFTIVGIPIAIMLFPVIIGLAGAEAIRSNTVKVKRRKDAPATTSPERAEG